MELKGTVDKGLEGQPVAVEIKDAEGNVILIRTVTSDINGEFVLKFKVPLTAKAGEFDIVTNIELDGQSFSETTSVESVKAETTPELASEPNCGEGTILKDGMCIVDTSKSSKGGGCLIATATYGSELAPQVQQLRELRDNQLLQIESGTSFMKHFNDFYYSFSPIIADYERENPVFKEMVKVAITPMITSLSILNYVDMDSEESVLGYGISLIVLNGLMYVGIPIAGIVVIRRL
ncbi:MAG: copper-binding protein [Nitrosopumilus sp.]|nr:copper-binding protein [Nitrosopumilus sp.]MDF2425953.1 copper-binding protein [Nitrosopumilus sp.]MDF2427577.1 copper-binding protein [Nitrosopumilus sp.]MDF2428605.1 copper-binding protein [Nitrosopumilus sp.]MDF2429859.1 copper-binding protein [Nitrosopumilus sp.]